MQLGAIVLPLAPIARLSPQVLPADVLSAVTPPGASLSVGHRGVGPNMVSLLSSFLPNLTLTIQAIGNSTGANTAMLARRRRRVETPSPPSAASIYDRASGPSPTPVRRKKTNVGATTVSLGVNARNMVRPCSYTAHRLSYLTCAPDLRLHRRRQRRSRKPRPRKPPDHHRRLSSCGADPRYCLPCGAHGRVLHPRQ